MSTSAVVSIGVGLDTARYGHHVSFLRSDLQPAAKAFTFAESPAGYAQLGQTLNQLNKKYGSVHFMIRIDAAGQYATNLERFLRALPCDKTISVGQPKQNRDYRNVHFPKRKADAVDSLACARFALVEQPAATPETPTAVAQLREIAGALESQADLTTSLVNQLHNRLSFDALPPGAHQKIETIPGIGKQTAAALVAKMVSIDRFATPDSVVNYFGCFPEENTSGTDKSGRPVPPGTMRISPNPPSACRAGVS